MSDFNDVGKLKHLPLLDIKQEDCVSYSDFIITAAATAVSNTAGRNWLPVIVKEVGDKYEVVSNHFVYAVAQKAKLERVWCIVIEPDEQNIEQAKLLSRETLPKVNLSIAPKETIATALKYLVNESGSVLSKLDVAKTVDKVVASNRETWVNLDVITTLKCGITKGDKLNAFSKVFFVSPTKTPEPTLQAPEIINIKRASRDEIFSRLSYLSKYKIGGFEAIDPDRAADVIFTASKSKWKSLNPITKLECGIDTAKIKTLKTVFSL